MKPVILSIGLYLSIILGGIVFGMTLPTTSLPLSYTPYSVVAIPTCNAAANNIPCVLLSTPHPKNELEVYGDDPGLLTPGILGQNTPATKAVPEPQFDRYEFSEREKFWGRILVVAFELPLMGFMFHRLMKEEEK